MKVSQHLKASLLLLSVLLSLQANKSAAEEVSWAQVFSPNRIAELLLQYGIQTARGFADITYQDLTVDLLRSNASVKQVKIWPMPDWEGAEDCVISIEQVDLSGNPFTAVDNSRVELVLQGLKAPLVCLPSEMRLTVVAAGQDSIRVDLVRSKFDYDVPNSSLTAQISARVPGFAALEVHADADYISYWLREEGYPVIYLNSARMRIENLGGWEELKPALPPSLTDPSSGGETLNELLTNLLDTAFGITQPLTEAQNSFLDSAKSTWIDFLTDPSQLTLSLLNDTEGPRFVDFEALGTTGVDIFTELTPELSSGWRPKTVLVSKEIISSAMTEGLSNDARLQIAGALISGTGVPRNRSLGAEILTELAGVGDAKAQAMLAEVLSDTDIEEAYNLAIAAAASGNEQAVLLLDHLEEELPWSSVVRLQPKASSKGVSALKSEKDVALVRSLASSSLRGFGSPRSYAQAMYWALLGKAFGDQESDWIVKEIERRVKAFNDSDLQEFLDPIEDAALEFWILEQEPER